MPAFKPDAALTPFWPAGHRNLISSINETKTKSKKGHRLRINFYALSPLWLALSACSMVDAEERTLPLVATTGHVVESALSNEELALLGDRVVYRFRSVPNLVFVRSLPSDREGFTPIEKSQRFQKIIATHDKLTYPLSAEPAKEVKQDSVGHFEDGGFKQAFEALVSENVELKKVRVAIIDSGVVASTDAIQSALKWFTNFTLDTNSDSWQSHATAIASVFAGMTRDGQIVDAYAPNAEIHSIKIAFQGDAQESMREELGSLQLAAALDEAIAGGAKVVNLSFTYRDNVPSDILAVERLLMFSAREKGVVFVAAAGNGRQNIDNEMLYPARYDLSNILVVGSHKASLRKAESSNYGSRVDITAQGVDVPVNTKSGGISFASGTSFAVPMVAAALSLYLGVLPEANLSQTVSDLFSTAKQGYNEDYLVSLHGRLDAGAFVKQAIHKLSKNSSR